MYFPYLRGRQFELLAIRELIIKGLIGSNVFPIIEPVHLNSTLLKTLEICKAHGYHLGLVKNPTVGSFVNEVKNSSDPATKILRKRYEDFINQAKETIVPVYIISQNGINIPEMESDHEIITICESSDALTFFTQISEKQKQLIQYNLIPDNARFKRNTIGYKNVLLADYFNKQRKNADYADESVVDEPYTDEYKFYKVDGYEGFGDYSIVGAKYNESGFAPYAVAIHIIYPTDTELRIHHFVSDSNDDITDVAGKFGEAVGKLVNWKQSSKRDGLNTFGMSQFEHFYNTQTFPGLGVIKKLSIMHHLELMGKLGDKEGKI